jgi:hypothetical protein
MPMTWGLISAVQKPVSWGSEGRKCRSRISAEVFSKSGDTVNMPGGRSSRPASAA